MKTRIAAFVSLLSITSVHGVVVISGASNTTAPGGQPYFNNIGRVGDEVGGASGIYLGDRWVLTAAHVAGSLPANASFGGTSYATQPGTYHHLANPLGYGMSTFTDIVLFRLASDPGLPSLDIHNSTPTIGDDIMMIGRGRSQEATPTYWDVTVVAGPGNDIWTELTFPNPSIDAAGFKTTATQAVRWGENDVGTTGLTINYGAGDVRMFTTTFDSGAKTHEAQAVVGDSGGAVLFHNGVNWVLSGMMGAVGTYENQPGGANTAVIGNQTAIADLSFYRTAILGVIPEPSSAGIVLMGCIGLASRRRR
jgi:Trypsin